MRGASRLAVSNQFLAVVVVLVAIGAHTLIGSRALPPNPYFDGATTRRRRRTDANGVIFVRAQPTSSPADITLCAFSDVPLDIAAAERNPLSASSLTATFSPTWIDARSPAASTEGGAAVLLGELTGGFDQFDMISEIDGEGGTVGRTGLLAGEHVTVAALTRHWTSELTQLAISRLAAIGTRGAVEAAIAQSISAAQWDPVTASRSGTVRIARVQQRHFIVGVPPLSVTQSLRSRQSSPAFAAKHLSELQANNASRFAVANAVVDAAAAGGCNVSFVRLRVAALADVLVTAIQNSATASSTPGGRWVISGKALPSLDDAGGVGNPGIPSSLVTRAAGSLPRRPVFRGVLATARYDTVAFAVGYTLQLLASRMEAAATKGGSTVKLNPPSVCAVTYETGGDAADMVAVQQALQGLYLGAASYLNETGTSPIMHVFDLTRRAPFNSRSELESAIVLAVNSLQLLGCAAIVDAAVSPMWTTTTPSGRRRRSVVADEIARQVVALEMALRQGNLSRASLEAADAAALHVPIIAALNGADLAPLSDVLASTSAVHGLVNLAGPTVELQRQASFVGPMGEAALLACLASAPSLASRVDTTGNGSSAASVIRVLVTGADVLSSIHTPVSSSNSTTTMATLAPPRFLFAVPTSLADNSTTANGTAVIPTVLFDDSDASAAHPLRWQSRGSSSDVDVDLADSAAAFAARVDGGSAMLSGSTRSVSALDRSYLAALEREAVRTAISSLRDYQHNVSGVGLVNRSPFSVAGGALGASGVMCDSGEEPLWTSSRRGVQGIDLTSADDDYNDYRSGADANADALALSVATSASVTSARWSHSMASQRCTLPREFLQFPTVLPGVVRHSASRIDPTRCGEGSQLELFDAAVSRSASASGGGTASSALPETVVSVRCSPCASGYVSAKSGGVMTIMRRLGGLNDSVLVLLPISNGSLSSLPTISIPTPGLGGRAPVPARGGSTTTTTCVRCPTGLTSSYTRNTCDTLAFPFAAEIAAAAVLLGVTTIIGGVLLLRWYPHRHAPKDLDRPTYMMFVAIKKVPRAWRLQQQRLLLLESRHTNAWAVAPRGSGSLDSPAHSHPSGGGSSDRDRSPVLPPGRHTPSTASSPSSANAPGGVQASPTPELELSNAKGPAPLLPPNMDELAEVQSQQLLAKVLDASHHVDGCYLSSVMANALLFVSSDPARLLRCAEAIHAAVYPQQSTATDTHVITVSNPLLGDQRGAAQPTGVERPLPSGQSGGSGGGEGGPLPRRDSDLSSIDIHSMSSSTTGSDHHTVTAGGQQAVTETTPRLTPAHSSSSSQHTQVPSKFSPAAVAAAEAAAQDHAAASSLQLMGVAMAVHGGLCSRITKNSVTCRYIYEGTCTEQTAAMVDVAVVEQILVSTTLVLAVERVIHRRLAFSEEFTSRPGHLFPFASLTDEAGFNLLQYNVRGARLGISVPRPSNRALRHAFGLTSKSHHPAAVASDVFSPVHGSGGGPSGGMAIELSSDSSSSGDDGAETSDDEGPIVARRQTGSATELPAGGHHHHEGDEDNVLLTDILANSSGNGLAGGSANDATGAGATGTTPKMSRAPGHNTGRGGLHRKSSEQSIRALLKGAEAGLTTKRAAVLHVTFDVDLAATHSSKHKARGSAASPSASLSQSLSHSRKALLDFYRDVAEICARHRGALVRDTSTQDGLTHTGSLRGLAPAHDATPSFSTDNPSSSGSGGGPARLLQSAQRDCLTDGSLVVYFTSSSPYQRAISVAYDIQQLVYRPTSGYSELFFRLTMGVSAGPVLASTFKAAAAGSGAGRSPSIDSNAALPPNSVQRPVFIAGLAGAQASFMAQLALAYADEGFIDLNRLPRLPRWVPSAGGGSGVVSSVPSNSRIIAGMQPWTPVNPSPTLRSSIDSGTPMNSVSSIPDVLELTSMSSRPSSSGVDPSSINNHPNAHRRGQLSALDTAAAGSNSMLGMLRGGGSLLSDSPAVLAPAGGSKTSTSSTLNASSASSTSSRYRGHHCVCLVLTTPLTMMELVTANWDIEVVDAATFAADGKKVYDRGMVIAVRGKGAAAATGASHTGAPLHDGEWMYELEANVASNPRSFLNRAWESYSTGDIDAANAALKSMEKLRAEATGSHAASAFLWYRSEFRLRQLLFAEQSEFHTATVTTTAHPSAGRGPTQSRGQPPPRVSASATPSSSAASQHPFLSTDMAAIAVATHLTLLGPALCGAAPGDLYQSHVAWQLSNSRD